MLANSFDVSVKFAPLVANVSKARKILLADIEPGADISGKVADNAIRRILEICAGLQIALAVTALGLGDYVRDS